MRRGTGQKDIVLLAGGIAIVLFLAFGFGHGVSSGSSNPGPASSRGELRLAYFPNLTHAQALIGVANGTFQKQLGDIRLKTTLFNAGPEAMEALLAGAIDAAPTMRRNSLRCIRAPIITGRDLSTPSTVPFRLACSVLR